MRNWFIPMSSYFSVVLQRELFIIFPYLMHFCKPHLLRGREGEAGLQMHQLKKENIWCTTPSAVTFALWFDSPLALSQPCSPDKKDPLLRCFARHYKTVAMDTHSEQAPHPGSRVGNDRCNISLFFFFFKLPFFFSCQQLRSWCSVVLQMPEIKTCK